MNTWSISCDTETDVASVHASSVRDWTLGVEGFLIRLFDIVGEWHDRAVSRRSLAKLDGRMLANIGVDPAWAEAESIKPFWRG